MLQTREDINRNSIDACEIADADEIKPEIELAIFRLRYPDDCGKPKETMLKTAHEIISANPNQKHIEKLIKLVKLNKEQLDELTRRKTPSLLKHVEFA